MIGLKNKQILPMKGAAMESGSFRLSPVLIVVLLLSGCAGDYSKAVNEFHKAAKATKQSMISAQTAAREMLAEAQLQAVIARDATLKLKGCTTKKRRCQLEFRHKSTNEKLALAAIRPPLAAIVELAGAIKDYAQGLKEIADANETKMIESAVENTVGKIKSLVETTKNIAGELQTKTQPTQKTFNVDWTKPVSAGLKWALGEYISTLKVSALREATTAAKIPLKEATAIFQEGLTIFVEAQKTDLSLAVTQYRTAFLKERNETNYRKYVIAVSLYDVFLTKGPSDIPQKLGTAHSKLGEALNGNPKSLSEAFRYLRDVQVRAEAFKKVVMEFQVLFIQIREKEKAKGK